MGYKDKTFLSDNEKKQLQSRISHLLARYRKENELSQREMAEKTGYSVPRYLDFEKGLELNNMLLKAFDTIGRWANAVDQDPIEFTQYILEGSSAMAKQGKLLKWQQELLRVLRGVPQDLRREWSIAIARQRKKERLEMAIENMTYELGLSKKEIEIINSLLRVLHQEK